MNLHTAVSPGSDAGAHLSSFLDTLDECQAVDLRGRRRYAPWLARRRRERHPLPHLMKVLKAALWGLMHSGTRFPCWCSVMKRWINSEVATERNISYRRHVASVASVAAAAYLCPATQTTGCSRSCD